ELASSAKISDGAGKMKSGTFNSTTASCQTTAVPTRTVTTDRARLGCVNHCKAIMLILERVPSFRTFRECEPHSYRMPAFRVCRAAVDAGGAPELCRGSDP